MSGSDPLPSPPKTEGLVIRSSQVLIFELFQVMHTLVSEVIEPT